MSDEYIGTDTPEIIDPGSSNEELEHVSNAYGSQSFKDMKKAYLEKKSFLDLRFRFGTASMKYLEKYVHNTGNSHQDKFYFD
jgi:hypothetical protein